MKTLTATKLLCFFGFCSVLTPELQGFRRGLTVQHQWTQLEWNYGVEAERDAAIARGEFVPGAGVPIDSDVFYDAQGSIHFLTVPRFSDGRPGTLNTITNRTRNGNPLLEPFPNWAWNRNSSACNQDRLVSVFRTQIDECGRLWVLDTGKIGSQQLCAPQIIAFNPRTGAVLHRYEIPSDQITAQSLLITPVVDVRDPFSGCRNVFVYSADVTGFGLIVYDVSKGQSWRISNKLFYPIPDFGTFNIAGEEFDLMDGILGMALTPYRPGTDRVLLFHSLASNTENYVLTSVIRNGSLFSDNAEAAPRQFHVFRKTRRSQAAAEAIDRNGVMYFGGIAETDMKCWNTFSEYSQRDFDIVDDNHAILQFPSGVKIVNTHRGSQELWVVTCRIQKLYTGTLNDREVNFRVLSGKTNQLVQGTKCDYWKNNNNNIGGYGLLNRPQQNWGGVFSDGKRIEYGQKIVLKEETASHENIISTSEAVDTSDQLIFN